MFSERYGYKKPIEIQYKKISDNLRRRIWNLFYQYETRDRNISEDYLNKLLSSEPTIEEKIMDRLGYIIEPLGKGETAEKKLRTEVLNFFQWYEVYDFIEVHLSCLTEDEQKRRIEQYNELLEQEKSGYRIINGIVVPITNEMEIDTIKQAVSTEFESVNQHIQKALKLYADIKNPDYENSVKESISAVEAICCIITGMTGSNATLGNAIKKLKDRGIYIHSAMEKAFLSLYGYTSNEQGIRHGGIDFKNVPAEDAKYMLISCSAFVNYLIEKYEKHKID